MVVYLVKFLFIKRDGLSRVFPIWFCLFYRSKTYLISSPMSLLDSNMFFHLANGNLVREMESWLETSRFSQRLSGALALNYVANTCTLVCSLKFFKPIEMSRFDWSFLTSTPVSSTTSYFWDLLMSWLFLRMNPPCQYWPLWTVISIVSLWFAKSKLYFSSYYPASRPSSYK